MNKRSGAALAFTLKWLALPIVLAAVGFFFIGPRVTKPPTYTPASVSQPVAEPTDPEATDTHKGEPKVDVSAEPVRRSTPSHARRKRDREKTSNQGDGAEPAKTEGGNSNSEEPPSGRGG